MDLEGESKRKLATVRTDRIVAGEELEGFGGLCCCANSVGDGGGRSSRRPPGINLLLSGSWNSGQLLFHR